MCGPPSPGQRTARSGRPQPHADDPRPPVELVKHRERAIKASARHARVGPEQVLNAIWGGLDAQGTRCSLMREVRKAAIAVGVHQVKHTAFCADIEPSPLQGILHRHCRDEQYTRSLTLLRALRPIFWQSYAASWTKKRAGHHSYTARSQGRIPLKLSGPTTALDGGVTAASLGPAEAFHLASAGASSRSKATQAAQNLARSNLIASLRLLSK